MSKGTSGEKGKDERVKILDIYADLLNNIWRRVLPVMGKRTVVAIMKRALALTEPQNPFIRHLRVTGEGFSFEGLYNRASGEKTETIRAAFRDFTANVIEIITILTGDILTQRLKEMINGKDTDDRAGR